MSTVTEIEKLLTEVKGIVEKHKKVDEMTGKNFNIFKVCEIDEKEVLICRFIYQLINPKGLHNQGDAFLRKFITDVLGGVISDSDGKDDSERLVITENELLNVKVYKEFVINNNRRIDLFIETNEHTIPIEVKIFAGDQENQCNDYLKYSKNSKLYYLTLFGDPPSDYSYNYNNIKEKSVNFEDELDQKIEDIKDEISCISFRDHIVPWIEDCIKDINIIDKKQIVDNLMQFLNAVRGLCNMGDNDLNNNLKDILEESKNFEAYIEMKKCERDIKIDVLTKIVERLNAWAKENDFRIDDTYAKYKTEIESLCSGENIGENRPGFGVECKNQIDGCKLCVVIEAGKKNEGMWYGIYITNQEKWNENISHSIKEKLKLNTGYSDNIWIFRDFMQNSIGVPNFVEPNEAFAKLLGENESDTSNIDNFVKDIKKKFVDLINIIEAFK